MSTLHTKVQKKESKTNTQPQSKKTSLIQSNSFDEISQLQSSIGNQAVQKILNVTGVQAKLSVSSPTDSYEKEADSVADKVMNMSDIAVKKQTPVKIQQKTTQSDTSESISPSIESKINSLQGKGTPLSYKTKSFFTSRFGHDLSDVRVHTNTDSNNLAESINAKAFTKGNNIVFNKGEYNPQSSHGKRLLGHELTHVIQQGTIQTSNISRQEKPNTPKEPITKQQNTFDFDENNFLDSYKYFANNKYFNYKEFADFYKEVVTYKFLSEGKINPELNSYKLTLNTGKSDIELLSDMVKKIKTPIRTENFEISLSGSISKFMIHFKLNF